MKVEVALADFVFQLTAVTDTINDQLLVERSRGGDQGAFLLLYERHRTAIFGFAYRLTGSIEVAEDITHDCFLSLVRGSEKSPASATATFRLHLYSTARTLLLEYLRDSVQEPLVESIEASGPASTSGPPIATMPEKFGSVRVAVGKLPLNEREVLVLSEYEFLKLSEIAVIVGTDERTVVARLEHARKRLRAALMSDTN